jgi:hypothetical protein
VSSDGCQTQCQTSSIRSCTVQCHSGVSAPKKYCNRWDPFVCTAPQLNKSGELKKNGFWSINLKVAVWYSDIHCWVPWTYICWFSDIWPMCCDWLCLLACKFGANKVQAWSIISCVCCCTDIPQSVLPLSSFYARQLTLRFPIHLPIWFLLLPWLVLPTLLSKAILQPFSSKKSLSTALFMSCPDLRRSPLALLHPLSAPSHQQSCSTFPQWWLPICPCSQGCWQYHWAQCMFCQWQSYGCYLNNQCFWSTSSAILIACSDW